MSCETNFYQLLEDIFTGKKINGVGGYVNLLAVKHEYYGSVMQIFREEVEREPLIAGSFREEFYDKLYSFFEKYFSEAGSIYFVRTPKNKNVYEKVYSNREDVALFYKTNMLYYVKTETLFDDAKVEINENVAVSFDVSALENRKNNEKRKLLFSLDRIEDNVIRLLVTYAKGNAKTDLKGILREAAKKGLLVDADEMEKGMELFRRQSQADYFINKNAGRFLNEQLDYYMHDLLLREENVFDARRLEEMKLIHRYAGKLTNFIAQFEDELVRIWDKPKFVRGLGYLCSVASLGGETVGKVLAHKNFDRQIGKWKDQKTIEGNEEIDETYLREHPYLMLDTGLFKDLEQEIYNSCETKVRGVVINSENYQALHTIQKTYRNRVDVIYIDPPYNTDQDSFDYVDGYESASYLSMMSDRLGVAKNMLAEDGVLYISINDKQLYELKLICDRIFGKNNFVCNFIRKTKAGRTTASCIDLHHDYILCYTKNKKAFESAGVVGAKETERTGSISLIDGIPYKKRAPLYKVDGGRKGSQYRVHNPYLNIDHYPPIHYNSSVRFGWFLGEDNYNRALEQEPEGLNEGYEWQIVFIQTQEEWEAFKKAKRKRNPDLRDEDIYSFYFLRREPERSRKEYNHLSSLFCAEKTRYNNAVGTEELNRTLDNVKSLGEWISDIHPKPVSLISDLITFSTRYKRNVTFMDFFGGSGTSGEAVLSFSKNNPDVQVDYVLIEVNDYADTVLKRRVEKAHEKLSVAGIVKYYSLEQYADTLTKMEYDSGRKYMRYSAVSPYEQYIFEQDRKLLGSVKITENIEFIPGKIADDIDINESVSNLLGKRIKGYTDAGILVEDRGADLEVRTDFEKMTEEEKLKFIRLIRPLLWWGEG